MDRLWCFQHFGGLFLQFILSIHFLNFLLYYLFKEKNLPFKYVTLNFLGVRDKIFSLSIFFFFSCVYMEEVLFLFYF